MAFDLGTSYLYGHVAGVVNRESVLDMISNVDPFDTPLLNMMPKVPAREVTEYWLQDTLAATSTGGLAEGRPFAAADQTAPSRLSNITQIFGKDIAVSETQQAVSPYGFDDTFLYQIMKGTREVMRNVERRLFSPSDQSAVGTAVIASAAGTARAMKSLDDFITGNSWHAAGTAIGGLSAGTELSAARLSETSFNTALQLIYQDGGQPGFIFASPSSKRMISGYAGTVAAGGSTPTVYLNATERQIIRSVNSYLSDFGLLNVVLDRWEAQAANGPTDHTDRNGTIHFLDLPKVQAAFLRPIRFRRLAADGDRVRGQITGELTLRVLSGGLAMGRIWGITNLV